MPENSPKPRKAEDDELVRELAASGASLSEIAKKLAQAEAANKTRTEPGRHASHNLSVNKITWPQVGRVTEPGRYMFKFGWLAITAEDLAVWKQYPAATFTLYSTGAPTQPGDQTEEEAGEEFRLGTFELREHVSLSEK
jgi:hypothetical protein